MPVSQQQERMDPSSVWAVGVSGRRSNMGRPVQRSKTAAATMHPRSSNARCDEGGVVVRETTSAVVGLGAIPVDRASHPVDNNHKDQERLHLRMNSPDPSMMTNSQRSSVGANRLSGPTMVCGQRGEELLALLSGSRARRTLQAEPTEGATGLLRTLCAESPRRQVLLGSPVGRGQGETAPTMVEASRQIPPQNSRVRQTPSVRAGVQTGPSYRYRLLGSMSDRGPVNSKNNSSRSQSPQARRRISIEEPPRERPTQHDHPRRGPPPLTDQERANGRTRVGLHMTRMTIRGCRDVSQTPIAEGQSPPSAAEANATATTVPGSEETSAVHGGERRTRSRIPVVRQLETESHLRHHHSPPPVSPSLGTLANGTPSTFTSSSNIPRRLNRPHEWRSTRPTRRLNSPPATGTHIGGPTHNPINNTPTFPTGQVRSITSLLGTTFTHESLGLAEKVLALLPVTRFDAMRDSPESTQCMICLTHFLKDDLVRWLPCLHHFHCQCIDQWLHSARTCPICKLDIEQTNRPSDQTAADCVVQQAGSFAQSELRATEFRQHDFRPNEFRQAVTRVTRVPRRTYNPNAIVPLHQREVWHSSLLRSSNETRLQAA